MEYREWLKNIKVGEKFSLSNIRVLRAERYLKPGIHPQYFDLILGKVCQKDLPPYQGVGWKNLLK